MLQMEAVMCGTSHLKLHFELCECSSVFWMNLHKLGRIAK
jgi:hypothetical protein